MCELSPGFVSRAGEAAAVTGGGHKPEFDAWRWVPLAETPELIIPFKRDVYREVARLFAGVAR